MIINFVRADDWVVMYVDGVKKAEGHSLHYSHILDALGLAHTTREIECNDETHWIDFAERIEDVKLNKYGDTL